MASSESRVVQELSSRMQCLFDRKIVDFDLAWKAQQAWFHEVLENTHKQLECSSRAVPLALPPTPSSNLKIRSIRENFSTTKANPSGFFASTLRDGSAHVLPSGGMYGTLPSRTKSPYKHPKQVRRANTMREVTRPLSPGVTSFLMGEMGKKPTTGGAEEPADAGRSQLTKSAKSTSKPRGPTRRSSQRLTKKRKGRGDNSESERERRHAKRGKDSLRVSVEGTEDMEEPIAAEPAPVSCPEPSLDDDDQWEDTYAAKDVLRRVKANSKRALGAWTLRRSARRRDAVYSTQEPFFVPKKSSKILARIPSARTIVESPSGSRGTFARRLFAQALASRAATFPHLNPLRLVMDVELEQFPDDDPLDEDWDDEGVEGEIDPIPGEEDEEKESNLYTLDEPIWKTIGRDIISMALKMMHVIIPLPAYLVPKQFSGHRKHLNDWDLYGPLFICLSLAIVLSINAEQDQAAIIFTAVFVIMWVGSTVVALNAILVGGKGSIFQSICVLGYCIAPLTLSAIVIHIVHIFWKNVWFRLGVVLLGLIWSVLAAYGFVSTLMPKKHRYTRSPLAIYPVGLFYTVLAWMVFMMKV